MFTGIVEETGRIRERTATDEGLRLRIECAFADELGHGQSISVNGACLTVEERDEEGFSVFLSEETVDRTYLGDLAAGDPVNLERAMRADGRFDGHLVQGHVDGVGEVRAIESIGEDRRVDFSVPADLASYVVEKGSIAVDGISLTVADHGEGTFAAAIVPTTYGETTLSGKEVGDPVHLEADVIAKYVERMVAPY